MGRSFYARHRARQRRAHLQRLLRDVPELRAERSELEGTSLRIFRLAVGSTVIAIVTAAAGIGHL